MRTKDMQDFYEKYNLSKYYFAQFVGVSPQTLTKFTKGEPIREEARKKIVTAMRVIKKNNMCKPEYDRHYAFDTRYNSRHCDMIRIYEHLVRVLIERES